MLRFSNPKLLTSTALAMALAVPSFALAQDAAAPAEGTTEVIVVPVAPELPSIISELGLTNVTQRDRGGDPANGWSFSGQLEDGTWVEVELNGDGSVDEIEARGGTFPASLIQHLLPNGITENPQWPHDANISKLDFDGNGDIEIEGWTVPGREFEVKFSALGQLIDIDTGEDAQ